MNRILQKPDIFGALASTLCVIHCIVTPLIFIAQTYSINNGETAPLWWRSLDYFFLMISLLAVYFSAKNTYKSYIKYALWICFTILFILILNEKTKWIHLPETIVYITAFTLAALHIYNLKYCQCQCKTDKSCSRKWIKNKLKS